MWHVFAVSEGNAKLKDITSIGSEPKILFLTIGQSPRLDLLGSLTEGLGLPAKISELGLLDGMSGREIEALRAETGQTAVTARLSNGAWLTLSRQKIAALAQDRIAALEVGAFDLVVLMSTGIFRDLESTCPTVNTQRAMDAAIISVAAQGDQVGLIFPLEQQIADFDIPSLALFETASGFAPHGDVEKLAMAARDLQGCSYVVLNSVGYSEEDRLVVADVTRKPVILPRRIISNSIRLILSSFVPSQPNKMPGGVLEQLALLTKRERQIMSLVCEGLSNKAIARQLDISYKTVEIHRSNVLRKMEAPSSGALIRKMVQAGLV